MGRQKNDKWSAEGNLSITGLDELLDDFEDAIREAPEKHKKLLSTLGDTVLKIGAKEIKEADAIETGMMLETYQKKNNRYKKSVNSRSVYLSIQAPHAHLLEYGHIQLIPSKTGNIVVNGRKYKEEGFVAGRLFFKGAFDKVEKQLPKTVELFIEDVLGKVFK